MTRDEMIAEFTNMLDEQYDDGYILGLQHGRALQMDYIRERM